MLHPYVRSVQGDYRGALAMADAAIEQMAESASPTVYLLALGAKAMSWLHLGRFGDVLRIVRTGREVSEKNDMDPWIFIFREAWLRTLCFDFEGARELGTVRMRSDSDKHAAQPRTIALVAEGHAELARQNYNQALECFRRVLDTTLTPNFFLHWHWRIQARIGATMAWLRAGDTPNARAEAAQCLEAAHSTADPNLKALALEVSARIAFAGQHRRDARQYLQNALAIVEEFEVPVAAWRIHAAAWDLLEDEVEAEPHRTAARDLVWTIANSLEDGEPLRKSLLSAAPVVRLFHDSIRLSAVP